MNNFVPKEACSIFFCLPLRKQNGKCDFFLLSENFSVFSVISYISLDMKKSDSYDYSSKTRFGSESNLN